MARINSKHGGPRPNSGRKSKAEEMGLAALLDKCWPVAEREKVIRALGKEAARGNVQAITLLLNYTFGKPTEKHEHGGEGGGPIEITVRHVKLSPKTD